MFVERMFLHRACRLRAATAKTLIKCVDPLNVCAVVTDQADTIWVFADFVHNTILLALLPVSEQY